MDNGLGPLPDIATVTTVFARASESGMAAASDFRGGILEPLAGLVDAHRRMAAAQARWDDVEVVWASSPVPVLAAVGADSFAGAWENAQRHMLDIDLVSCEILGDPSAEAVEHHEGLGAVFGRMVHLHRISFNPFILDGPAGRNRQQFGRALISYERLACELICGRVYLPSPFTRPDS
ncbi:hypothetical protein [Nocardia abscessus]|uniref:hypothetical protein n=1 Tax=Nocardia abscessus TaxID=120957 RepID=UPI0024549EBE|nr:hypothetical protein [Nocardia abscessus]